jgi:hypothetical protein
MKRFTSVNDMIDRVSMLGRRTSSYAKREIRNKPLNYRQYISLYGKDMSDIRD